MSKEELRQELVKYEEWARMSTSSLNIQETVNKYLSSLEPKQPELKGISEAFQNFTNELKSMGL